LAFFSRTIIIYWKQYYINKCNKKLLPWVNIILIKITLFKLVLNKKLSSKWQGHRVLQFILVVLLKNCDRKWHRRWVRGRNASATGT
jgi:hypothetical protein